MAPVHWYTLKSAEALVQLFKKFHGPREGAGEEFAPFQGTARLSAARKSLPLDFRSFSSLAPLKLARCTPVLIHLHRGAASRGGQEEERGRGRASSWPVEWLGEKFRNIRLDFTVRRACPVNPIPLSTPKTDDIDWPADSYRAARKEEYAPGGLRRRENSLGVPV